MTTTYSTWIKGYIPPSVRKAASLARPKELENNPFRHERGKVQSYRHLLPGIQDSRVVEEPLNEYYADFLDDPELRTGKHRTVIALTSFLGSINHFTKAEFLKQELNEKFRKLHPTVHPSLTLSQIRNLKSKLLRIAVDEGLELSTVARTYTYLEKLILSRSVCKTNRKVVGGCCLLLATKATDSKATNYARLLHRLAGELQTSRNQLVELEFDVFAGLRFQLQVPETQYGGHLLRVLTQLDYSNLQEYLGERMHENWQQASTM